MKWHKLFILPRYGSNNDIELDSFQLEQSSKVVFFQKEMPAGGYTSLDHQLRII